MIGAAINAVLAADSAVVAIVGTRIRPTIRPQDEALPAITYSLLSAERPQHYKAPSGLNMTRMEIKTWATGYDAAHSLFELVRLALDGYRGTSASIVIESVILENTRDADEGDIVDSEERFYAVVGEFAIAFQETP